MTHDRSYCDEPTIPAYQIRAHFNDETIRVYQAYGDDIADTALANGTFISPPFSMNRMTWIKPSFLWMMYRSGWAQKDPGQKRILAIDITHDGFQWALDHAALSHCPEHMTHEEWRARKDASQVVIQWDPERDLLHRPLQHRSIQIGLSPAAVQLYVNEWIRKVTDVTELAVTMGELVKIGRLDDALSLIPEEATYAARIDDILPVRLEATLT